MNSIGGLRDMLKLPLEATFNEFVKTVGGEPIDQLLPNNAGRKRADFLFRSVGVIAELKCMERDIDMAEYRRKLTLRLNEWHRRGIIRVYGTTRLSLRNLPKTCQDEWLELHEAPIQKHILSDANQQIRDTKEDLVLPDAKGLVLIANEGHFFSSPADLLTYIARILKKRKSDGGKIYSNIHRIVIFSANVPLASPEFPQGLLGWVPAFRDENDQETAAFLMKLGESWSRFCAAKRGGAYIPVPMRHSQIEEMMFFKPPNY